MPHTKLAARNYFLATHSSFYEHRRHRFQCSCCCCCSSSSCCCCCSCCTFRLRAADDGDAFGEGGRFVSCAFGNLSPPFVELLLKKAFPTASLVVALEGSVSLEPPFLLGICLGAVDTSIFDLLVGFGGDELSPLLLHHVF